MTTQEPAFLPVAPSTGVLTPLPGEAVALEGGFWGDRQSRNAERFIPCLLYTSPSPRD